MFTRSATFTHTDSARDGANGRGPRTLQSRRRQPADEGQVPRSAWLFIGIAAIHIAAFLAWLDHRELLAASMLFVGQCVSCLVAVIRTGTLRVQDIRVAFLLVFSLYGLTLPVAFLSIPGHHAAGFISERSLALTVCLYGTALFGFGAVVAIRNERWRDVDLVFCLPSNVGSVIVMLALTCWLFVYARGAGMTVSLAKIDRSELSLVYSQLWGVSIFALNGALIYHAVRFATLPRWQQLATFTCVLGFIAFMTSLGNRRDYLPVVLAALLVNAIRSRRRLRSLFPAMIAIFVMLMLIGEARTETRSVEAPAAERALASNEFIYPIQTLAYYINYGTPPLKLGLTYIYWPAMLVPRSVWPDKPISLSSQFSLDAFGTTEFQGYAYTPITEAFINFGFVGPLLIGAALGLLLTRLIARRIEHPLCYTLAFGLVLDFNRGEFALTVYSMLVIAVGYGAAALGSRAMRLAVVESGGRRRSLVVP